MENQLASIVFLFTILCLTIIEKKRLNNLITPFTITAWPFVIIVILTNYILIYFNIQTVTIRAQFFILSNLLIIWVVGSIIYYMFFRDLENIKQSSFRNTFKIYKEYQIYIIIISWIIVLSVSFHIYSLVLQHGGWAFMGHQLYEDTVSKEGIGHLIHIGKVCFLFIFFTYRYSKSKLFSSITLLALVLIIAAIQVKYHLIWLLIFGFLFRNILKPSAQQLRNVLISSLSVFIMFSLFWIFLTVAWGTFGFTKFEVWEFIIKQFVNYFVTGSVNLEKWLDFSSIKPQWSLLIVLINFTNVIFGNPERLFAGDFVNMGFVEIVPGVDSNVGTSYGVYFLIGGYQFSYFMSFLIALFSYGFYYFSIKNRNPITIYFCLLFLTIGLLSFFGQYFALLSLYEMSIIYIFTFIVLGIINHAKSVIID
jgi:oligosaccharide repeat unit polymerase